MSATVLSPDVRPASGGWEWTIETLRKLDWKRWQALAVAVLGKNGYTVSPERVKPDGTRLYSLRRGAEMPVDSMLLLGGSLAAPIGAGELDLLSQEMAAESVAHGVIATVWPVSAEIASRAAAGRIMVIDGALFLANLAERSESDLAELASLATAGGSWATPSCPGCGQKMKSASSAEARQLNPPADLVCRKSATVTRPVHAGTLTVEPGVAMIFTEPVVASRLVVAGVIEGEFIVDGAVIVEPESTLRGKVTARSIDAREGAELDGEASIVSAAAIRAMMPAEPPQLWICQDYPRCSGTAPLRLAEQLSSSLPD